MKRFWIGLAAGAAFFGMNAQEPGETAGTRKAAAWEGKGAIPGFQRLVVFETDAIGRKMPIRWGFDTAWNDYDNMLRGVRYSGADAVSCARVSFQPWAEITEKGVLPESLQKNLDARMATVGLIGKKVDIVLNLDGGENTVKSVYGGYKYENPDDPWWSPKEYIGNVEEQGPKWADLIDATAAAVEAKGYNVTTASPLNEPDLELNGTPIELFYEIAKSLKDADRYPRFKNIRISGGNTLNNDEALRWYEYNKEFLDEGNTHQLAGCFDTYASFFEKVRADGKHATADELHNVMEAMVGVEYGMQTGIWWGTAERARGEFMKASAGERLGYAENRDAWSAASVYRNPQGGIQAFVGCSERQAKPSAYNFVAADRAVFINGVGPLREYVVNLPGDPDGEYQSERQRNAEAVLDISAGEDVPPYVGGDCIIANVAYKMAVSVDGGALTDGKEIYISHYIGAADQIWTVSDVPEDQGGDFSYIFIRNTTGDTDKSLDDNNWNLEDGGKVICYGFSGSGVQQWALEYAGNGNFRIRNKFSSLYLTIDEWDSSTRVVQREYAETEAQLWRFISKDAEVEFEAPSAPENLSASTRSASIELKWAASEDAQPVTYTIARADGKDGSFTVVGRGVAATEFLDNSLAGDNTYRYKIMAEDASGNRSAYCAETAVDFTAARSGMTAHYLFDGSTEDAEENQLDILLCGKETYGKDMTGEGKAIVFSSGAFAQLPYSIFTTDEFTVGFWCRVTSPQEGRCLFSTGLGAGNALELYPWTDGGMQLRVACGERAGIVSGASPEAREWHHMAIVVSKDEISLYADGEECAGGDGKGARGALPANRMLTYIATDAERGKTFTGSVADMRVYDRALDAVEVRAMMAGASGVESVDAGVAEIISVEYYSASGLRLAAPAQNGVTIKRTSYSDGTVRIEKVLTR